MDNKATITEAKNILGKNFIGPEELKIIQSILPLKIPLTIPEITVSKSELEAKNKSHVLVLALSHYLDGQPVTMLSIRNLFGITYKPELPCFYNQDWYLKEKFMYVELKTKWLFLRKSLSEESRGQSPDDLIKINTFPQAVECTYTFFTNHLLNKGLLWINDYVWCSDEDDKGDRVYVGRYLDPSGMNVEGFEIHRHLKIKMNYGSI